MTMSVLDIVFLVILVFFLIRGFMRGIIREMGAIAAIIVGYLVASKYFHVVTPYLQSWFPSDQYLNLAAYIITFAGALTVTWVVASLLSSFVHSSPIAFADHSLGAVLGFAKGAILCGIIFIAITAFMPTSPVTQDSRLAPYAASVAEILSGILPEDMREAVERHKALLPNFELPDISFFNTDTAETQTQ